MARLTFFGGVHPYDGKELSKDCPVQTLFPEDGEMVFPLIQHIGRPSIPIVQEGDRVRTGQLIGAAGGEISANLHSSVSGMVLGVENRKTADGRVVPSIIIRNDGLYLEENRGDVSTKTLTAESILDDISMGGIVGMGGAGLPTAFKIREARNYEIDTVIANCVECEPYLTSDYRRILEAPWKVINGLMILLALFPRARGIVAVSDSNEEGYRLLRNLLEGNERIGVRKVKAKYPQGSERQLIYALTGRTLNAKMLPYDIGCLVNSTDTLVAINQAVLMHEPLITRIVTVTGDGAAHPANFRVRIGMSYRDILEQAGGLREGLSLEDVLILDGGPMMGRPLMDLNVPVTKLTTAIVVLDAAKHTAQKQTACTRCGRCVDACPNRLVPLILEQDVKKNNAVSFVRHNGLECCSCGCCSYICPSKIPLSAEIFAMRARVMARPEIAGEYERRFLN